ncbi:MAG: DUF6398 domain-containing protein [Anaerolineae bacterium]
MDPKGSPRVPAAMQAAYQAIVAITDEFCMKHLNEEYAALAREMAAALARKRPSPIGNNRPRTWAAGILYALGQNNFLFDKNNTPHMRADELCERMGVAQSTASNTARKIRDLLKMDILDPRWTLPSKLDDHPFLWLVSVNGFIIDIRTAPREIQELAYRKGLIPYIPADRKQD